MMTENEVLQRFLEECDCGGSHLQHEHPFIEQMRELTIRAEAAEAKVKVLEGELWQARLNIAQAGLNMLKLQAEIEQLKNNPSPKEN